MFGQEHDPWHEEKGIIGSVGVGAGAGVGIAMASASHRHMTSAHSFCSLRILCNVTGSLLHFCTSALLAVL